MSTALTQINQTNLATIELADCEIAKAIITIDLHDTNSLHDQALFACYGELLLAGTDTLTRQQIQDSINKIGAGLSVNIDGGQLELTLTSIATAWPALLKIVESILLHASFSTKEIARVKKSAHNDLHNQQEDGTYQAHQVLTNALYDTTDRQAQLPEKTIQAEVATLQRSAFKTLHTRMLQRPAAASVVGNNKVVQTFETFIKKVSTKQALAVDVTGKTRPVTKQKIVTTDIPSLQNIDFSIGCVTPLLIRDDEYSSLLFGMAVLGKWGGFAGRLMSTVREKEGLTYSIYGRLCIAKATEHGYARIMTFFSPKQVHQGLTSTFREINQIVTQGITDQELIAFKEILFTQSVLRNDSPGQRLAVLHYFNELGFTLIEIERYEAALQQVTKQSVNAALSKYIVPNNLIVSAAGPVKNMRTELLKLRKSLP